MYLSNILKTDGSKPIILMRLSDGGNLPLFKILIILSFMFLIVTGYSQNTQHFYYVIKKSAVESDKLKIIYKDDNGIIRQLKMCYPKLKAEDLTMQNGIPVFHFEKIKSSEFDSIPDCISNTTPTGRFEIDVSKKRIGDENIIAKIPFHAFTWGVSIIPYRIRFPQYNVPLSSDSKIDFSFMYGFTTGVAKVNHERITHYYFTTSAFAGATSASLKKETVTNPQLLSTDQNNVAFAYGLNLMAGRNNFGISFSFGFDVAFGKNSSIWIYQNKPWVGIGFSSNLGLLK